MDLRLKDAPFDFEQAAPREDRRFGVSSFFEPLTRTNAFFHKTPLSIQPDGLVAALLPLTGARRKRTEAIAARALVWRHCAAKRSTAAPERHMS